MNATFEIIPISRILNIFDQFRHSNIVVGLNVLEVILKVIPINGSSHSVTEQ